MTQWRPLSRRDDPSYDALVEGVPPYLRASLWEWVAEDLTYEKASDRYGNKESLQEVERRLRWTLDWAYGAASALTSLQALVQTGGEERFLDVADLVLSHVTHAARADEVDTILRDGGSAWCVANRAGVYRLERRVNPTVAQAAEEVMGAAGKAGKHLSLAWTAAYGREPNASSAYREAVRGVEAAAVPVVSPNNGSATLGTIIADIRKAPDKWTMRLTPPSNYPAVARLLGMLELLWKSEIDRHGTPDEAVPLTVSLLEGQDAVHLAVTLVQWFTSGAIRRVDG